MKKIKIFLALMGATLLSANALAVDNIPPDVNGIPGQTINEGGKFASFKLDNYVCDDMDKPEQIKWSVSGNKNLKVKISADRVATIETPHQYWNGSEDITFAATDTKGAVGYETVTFTVKHDFDENGFCRCDDYQPAEKNDDGYYKIANAGNLCWFADYVNQLGDNLKANAILTNDIVVNTLKFADGEIVTGGWVYRVWSPIGPDCNYPYQGTFDGNGYTISGLYFNDPDQDFVGLFGCNNGTIQNAGVVDSYFYGKDHVGGVCGGNAEGKIENCYNTGNVNGSASEVGGVCGYNARGTITNCHNTGNVNGSYNEVGGVCGYNFEGKIENCYNTGNVNGSCNEVGGVCGYNAGGTITNCHNTGNVNGSYNEVGGVCGDVGNYCTITNCYNTGEVNGDSHVGGVLGILEQYCNIENCYNTGEVNGSGDYVGGVCGENYGTIENCYNTGSVNGSGNEVGGVCGANGGTITRCYYLADTDDGKGGKTAEQFANGEVLDKLSWGNNGSVWGQDACNGDTLPNLSGNVIYKIDMMIGDTLYKSICFDDKKYICDGVQCTMETPFEPAEIEGYDFLGWYYNPDYTSQTRYISEVNGNSAVYGWVEKSGVEINETNFPDTTLRNIVAAADKNENGRLSDSEARGIQTLVIDGFTSLKGIEHAKYVWEIKTNDTLSIDTLDLSGFVALEGIYLNGANIKELKLSNLPELGVLSCVNSKFENVEIVSDTSLLGIDFKNVEIKNLSVADIPKLKYLFDSDNSCKIDTLAISNVGDLLSLDFQYADLKEVAISDMESLDNLNLANNQITKIDLNNLPALEKLSLGNNQLTNIDVTAFPLLNILWLENNHLINLNLDELIYLDNFYLYGNDVKIEATNEIDIKAYSNDFNPRRVENLMGAEFNEDSTKFINCGRIISYIYLTGESKFYCNRFVIVNGTEKTFTLDSVDVYKNREFDAYVTYSNLDKEYEMEFGVIAGTVESKEQVAEAYNAGKVNPVDYYRIFNYSDNLIYDVEADTKYGDTITFVMCAISLDGNDTIIDFKGPFIDIRQIDFVKPQVGDTSITVLLKFNPSDVAFDKAGNPLSMFALAVLKGDDEEILNKGAEEDMSVLYYYVTSDEMEVTIELSEPFENYFYGVSIIGQFGDDYMSDGINFYLEDSKVVFDEQITETSSEINFDVTLGYNKEIEKSVYGMVLLLKGDYSSYSNLWDLEMNVDYENILYMYNETDDEDDDEDDDEQPVENSYFEGAKSLSLLDIQLDVDSVYTLVVYLQPSSSNTKDLWCSMFMKVYTVKHNYTEPVFSWADDNMSATVALSCTTNPAHNKTLDAIITTDTITATCTANGLISHIASVDIYGQTISDTVTDIIAKLAHTVVVDSAVAATCSATGLTEGKHCSVCDSVLVAQQTVAKIAHTVVVDSAKTATCTVAGLTEGKHCSVCDSILVAQQTIPALGHKIETIAGVSSTCTAEGLTEGSRCSVCGEVIKAQQTLPALGHSFTNYIYNNDATTEADGTETAVCDHGCGATDIRTAEGTKLTDIDELETAEVVIYAHHNVIVVENAEADIYVYDVTGRCIEMRESCPSVEIAMQREGIYIVRTGDKVQRVAVK